MRRVVALFAGLTVALVPPVFGADSKEIAALVRTIDADADPLHLDRTPSVHKLAALGPAAGIAVLGLLDAPERDTRLHAQRVVEGVALAWYSQRAKTSLDGDPTRAELWRAWLSAQLPSSCVQVRNARPVLPSPRASTQCALFDKKYILQLVRTAHSLRADPDGKEDYPDAVWSLVNYQIEGGWSVVDLLDSNKPFLRLRAQHVLENVLKNHYQHAAQAVASELMKHNGYDAEDSPALRREAIARWKAWLVDPS